MLRSKIIAWLSMLALLGLVAAYVLEFRFFANTFEVGELIAKSIVVGLAVGFLLRWLLRKYATDLITNLQLWTACLSLPVLLAPFAGSLTNRLLSPHPVVQQSFGFFGEKAFAADRFGFIEGEKIQPDGYYIFIIRNGKLERLRTEIPRFAGVESGQTVTLPVKKGLWGYGVVLWQSMKNE